MPSEFAGAEAKSFAAEENGEPVTVYDQQGVVVKAFAVNHAPVHPAVGYRIEFGGKIVVISGDTTATASLATQSRDADLLVAEAMNMATVSQMQKANEQLGNDAIAEILHDIQSYHIDVEQLGQLTDPAPVKRLALTRLVSARAQSRRPLALQTTGEREISRRNRRRRGWHPPRHPALRNAADQHIDAVARPCHGLVVGYGWCSPSCESPRRTSPPCPIRRKPCRPARSPP